MCWVVRAIFYTHQSSGACADACTYDHTHQMDKAVVSGISRIGYSLLSLISIYQSRSIRSTFSRKWHVDKISRNLYFNPIRDRVIFDEEFYGGSFWTLVWRRATDMKLHSEHKSPYMDLRKLCKCLGWCQQFSYDVINSHNVQQNCLLWVQLLN